MNVPLLCDPGIVRLQCTDVVTSALHLCHQCIAVVTTTSSRYQPSTAVHVTTNTILGMQQLQFHPLFVPAFPPVNTAGREVHTPNLSTAGLEPPNAEPLSHLTMLAWTHATTTASPRGAQIPPQHARRY